MNKAGDSDAKKMKSLLGFYNMVPNLLWSLFGLLPVAVFCYRFVDIKMLCIFLLLSLFPAILKNSLLDKLRISENPQTYKRLGVHHINRVAQNGAIIQQWMKRKYPDFRVVRHDRASIKKLLNQTYMFEKFHWVLAVYFTMIFIYAMAQGRMIWALVILLTNIGYNIYPNLLQQYIRLKLSRYS